MADRLAVAPDKSVAAAMPDEAEREAAYRFLRNDEIEFDDIVAPHIAQTVERARTAKTVIVAHDTTEVGFSTPRAGLGRINDDEMGRGFYLHTALAVSGDGRREPLGVLGTRRLVRLTPRRKKKRKHTETVDELAKESSRWWELASEASSRLDRASAVHVMDREADSYVLLARLIDGGHRFVVRVKHDRRIELEGAKQPTLKTELKRLDGLLSRQITVAPREPKPLAKPLLPPSRARTAKLEFRATTVVLCRPSPSPATDFDLPRTLTVNVVHVVEVDHPEGYEPIDWKLYTTDSIASPEAIEAIVDAYDTRWIIEEYFKALKTGCALEKRELESADTIFTCTAILMPIAWSVLRLRNLARDDSDAPAGEILTPVQIKVLQRHRIARMTAVNPTVGDAFLAIARLGRHIKRNGPPGWQVLMRGYRDLLVLAEGAALFGADLGNGGTTCDQ